MRCIVMTVEAFICAALTSKTDFPSGTINNIVSYISYCIYNVASFSHLLALELTKHKKHCLLKLIIFNINN